MPTPQVRQCAAQSSGKANHTSEAMMMEQSGCSTTEELSQEYFFIHEEDIEKLEVFPS